MIGAFTRLFKVLRIFLMFNMASFVFASIALANVSEVSDANAQVANFLSNPPKFVSADFEMEKFLSLNKKTFKSEGHAYISSLNGICWQILTPIQKAFIFKNDNAQEDFKAESNDNLEFLKNNGKNPNDQFAQPNNQQNLVSFMGDSFKALIVGDVEVLKENFEISNFKITKDDLEQDKKSPNKTSNQSLEQGQINTNTQVQDDLNSDLKTFYLRPKTAPLNKVIFSIQVQVLNDKVIKQLLIVEHNNSYTKIDFKNFDFNELLSNKDINAFEGLCYAQQ